MNTNNQGNFEFLDLISIISFSLQLMVLSETRNQSTTDDIFYELKQQDTRYLKRLLEGQQKILDKLAQLEADTPCLYWRCRDAP